MANILDRFQKEVVGSRGRIADYTPRITAKGDFARIHDITVILNSWNNILLTPTRSYTFDPEYGSNLYKYVFEQSDEDTIELISEEVKSRLMTYDDRARVVSVNVTQLSNLKGFNVEVVCDYYGEMGQLSADITEGIYLNILETV